MAGKIGSWEEYDAEVEERRKSFKKEVRSRLEFLIEQHPLIKANRKRVAKYRKKVGNLYILIDGAPRPLDVEEINKIESEVENKITEYLREELSPTAATDTIKRHFQDNLSRLVSWVIGISESQEYLVSEEKERLYVRVARQLYSFAAERKSLELKTDIPELEQLTKHYFPEEESAERLKRILGVMAQQKYLPRKTAAALLQLLTMENLKQTVTVPPPANLPAPSPAHSPVSLSPGSSPSSSPASLPSALLPSAIALGFHSPPPALPPSLLQRSKVEEYLRVMFELPAEMAGTYAAGIFLEQLEYFHEHLDEIVGKEHSLQLVQSNPELLASSFAVLQDYLRTLKLIQKEIGMNGNRKQGLEERFGLEKNRARYAGLNQLLELKRELFTMTGSYAGGGEPAPPAAAPEFDVEKYKDRLLQRTGLDIDLVRGFTEGKTAYFKGEMYMPAEYFRKNAAGKVGPAKFSALWKGTFEELVRRGAIVRKHKANPLYRLNPHVTEITDQYLREYMRVTLYSEQIIAQEKKITPLIDLDRKEEK